jgi:hypothetical protein
MVEMIHIMPAVAFFDVAKNRGGRCIDHLRPLPRRVAETAFRGAGRNSGTIGLTPTRSKSELKYTVHLYSIIRPG